MTREEMLQALHHNTCKVTFVKADNSIREMLCTLDLDNVQGVPETFSSNPQPSEERITVWDLEKSAWRQFKIESIIDFEAKNS